MTRSAIAKAFGLQSQWCAALGSPFMAALMDAVRGDIEAGGPLAELLGDWPGEPLADAVPIRFAGALHAAVLSGRDAALAAEYPGARGDWDMARIWPHVSALVSRDRAWLLDQLSRAPQTNETRRAIAMLPAFLACAALGPLHLREIGASAGLNRYWPRFRYRTANWSWGEGDGPLLETDWRGPPPQTLLVKPQVSGWRGCDVSPIDVRDPAQALRLRSYLWPDQPDRLARLDALLALAGDDPPPERSDAGDWLERELAGDLPEGVTVIYHSVVWQYLPQTTKAKAHAAIAAAAERADSRRCLAWLRYEPNPILDGEGLSDGFGVDLTLWPGAVRQRLADTDGHARFVTWRG